MRRLLTEVEIVSDTQIDGDENVDPLSNAGEGNEDND
jgi:hypothetical protein